MSTPPSQRAALRLSALLLGAGAAHFASPRPFDRIVPTALPGSPRTYTYVSGVAELTAGTALAIPRTRRLGGTLAAALLIAVFPANVQMAVDWLGRSSTPLPLKAVAVARLPLQLPLIAAALKVRRDTA